MLSAYFCRLVKTIIDFKVSVSASRRAALAEELAVLRQVDEFASKGVSPPRGKNGYSR